MTVKTASHNAPMETIECFMFGKMCACLAVFRNIDQSNSPSIVDYIMWILGNFVFIIFFVGRTLLMWEDTAMKFPVHPGSATAKFSSFVACVIFVVGDQAKLLHTYLFSVPL